nr:ATP synthase F0 subunit 8 [Ariomma brevimanus]
MPQLDPNPWFLIFFWSWVTLTVIIIPKVLAHRFPNDMNAQSINTPKGQSWDWPWH